jgi:CheY-like chemotaxis protein
MKMKKPVQILIVDDESAVRFLTRRSLEKFEASISFIIKEAINGAHALQYISTASLLPDIILLDIQMPVMNGFEFLEEYRKLVFPRNQRPAIYVLSNVINDNLDNIRTIGKSSIKGIFEKPFTDDHIEMILSSFSLQDAL